MLLLQDCNNSDGENMTKANVAATRIQANFRGYRVRKRLKESNRDVELKSSNTAAVIDSECEQHRRRKERLEAGEGGRSTIPSEENGAKESLEEQSATKIQAGVRGFLVRKRQQIARVAATKIQAGFRGFRTRKLLKQSEPE